MRSIQPKVKIIRAALKARVPLVSTMGAGGRMDPTQVAPPPVPPVPAWQHRRFGKVGSGAENMQDPIANKRKRTRVSGPPFLGDQMCLAPTECLSWDLQGQAAYSSGLHPLQPTRRRECSFQTQTGKCNFQPQTGKCSFQLQTRKCSGFQPHTGKCARDWNGALGPPCFVLRWDEASPPPPCARCAGARAGPL